MNTEERRQRFRTKIITTMPSLIPTNKSSLIDPHMIPIAAVHLSTYADASGPVNGLCVALADSGRL